MQKAEDEVIDVDDLPDVKAFPVQQGRVKSGSMKLWSSKPKKVIERKYMDCKVKLIERKSCMRY